MWLGDEEKGEDINTFRGMACTIAGLLNELSHPSDTIDTEISRVKRYLGDRRLLHPEVILEIRTFCATRIESNSLNNDFWVDDYRRRLIAILWALCIESPYMDRSRVPLWALGEDSLPSNERPTTHNMIL